MSNNKHPGLNLELSRHQDAWRSEVNVFGFWVFMMSDLIIFGLLFATYATMNNHMGLAGGPAPKQIFDLGSVAWQTAFLLTSAFTCGLLGLTLKYEPKNTSRLLLWLSVTAALGAGFLILEFLDFKNMWQMGATPMRSGWLSSLYALLGLHGLHIIIGLIWALVLAYLLMSKGMSDRFRTRMLVFILFWHFLDLIWVGIFSMVFLGGLI